jgi:hypothetical protein
VKLLLERGGCAADTPDQDGYNAYDFVSKAKAMGKHVSKPLLLACCTCLSGAS